MREQSFYFRSVVLMAGLALLCLSPARAADQCNDSSSEQFGDLLSACHSDSLDGVCEDPDNVTSAIVQIGGPSARSSSDEDNLGVCVPYKIGLLDNCSPAAAIIEFEIGNFILDDTADELRISVNNSDCTSALTALFFNIPDGATVALQQPPDGVSGCATWNLEQDEALAGPENNGTGFGADGFGRTDAVIYNGNVSPNGGNPCEILANQTVTFLLDITAGSVNLCDLLSETSVSPPGSIETNRNVIARFQSGAQGDSAFIGPCSGQLFVQLAKLSVEPHDGRVKVLWDTRTEIDNEGFNVIRRELVRPHRSIQLNAALLPGRGDTFTGHSYEWVDETAVNGVTYKYYLEDIDSSGLNTIHGPRVAISNPRNPRIRLLSPEYGAEIANLRQVRFAFNTNERGRLKLEISADAAFSQETVEVFTGAGRKVGITLGASEARRVRDLAQEADGVLYWRISSRRPSPNAGSDSQTFRFRLNPAVAD